MKFRKKPVVIEAIQWTGNNLKEMQDFGKGFREITESNHFENRLAIKTLEGIMTAKIDDWIIKGVKGEIYPCKPDIFDQTYEIVE